MEQIIKEGQEKQRFSVTVDINQEEKDIPNELTGEEIYDWMEENYKDETDLGTYKQVFAAILSDFLQFVLAGLRASERGHLSVTFSVLRKPLKDNLFVLERLVSNPNEFLMKFNSEDSYEKICTSESSPEEKKKIIRDVLTKIRFKILDEEIIYEIRYDKKKDFGLEKLFQKATHIVTSYNHLETEQGNLNFVFSSEDAKKDQWRHLYSILPLMLFYAYQVALTVYYGVIVEDEERNQELWNRIIIGYVLSNKLSAGKRDYIPIDEISDNMTLTCHECKEEIEYTDDLEEEIIKRHRYFCSKNHENHFFKLKEE